MEKIKKTIGMLLDIANLNGEHQGSLTPWLIVLAGGLSPTLVYVYFQLFLFVPIWLFAPANVFLLIRLIMIFPGREKHRVNIFKRQLNSKYMATADMLNTKVIHEDGCIEYVSGKVMYLVACYNGTIDNEEAHSVQLHKFINSLTSGYDYDIYILNMNDSPALRNLYNRVHTFNRNISARNFIQMIDHNIKLTNDTSKVLCTIYAIRGNRSDWKAIRSQVDNVLGSTTSRCYKIAIRIEDSEAINEVFNRDSDSVINIDELTRHKYVTEEYHGSKVIAYDLPEDQIVIQGQDADKPVIPVQTKSTFHVQFKEDS